MNKTFFVFAFIISGIMLLLSNLGIVSIGFSMVWPILSLIYGVYLINQFQRNHQSDVLSSAAFFTLAGIFFFTTNFFIWPENIPWWPVLPLFWGLGNFLTWMAGGRRDNGMLLQSVVLAGASTFILLGGLSWSDTYLKFWPVILILIGIVLLFGSNKSKRNNFQEQER